MGGPFTMAAIYLTIWWTILFAILPLGTQTHAEAGVDPQGGDPGSPVDPKLKKKFLTTTWVSALIFAALWLILHFKLITPDMIPFWRPTQVHTVS